jgi:glucose-6-phosphate isomerase
MWDWVGGRTSELSAVGLLPAALQGIDIQAMLDGAAAMDDVSRYPVTAQNPAALLALYASLVGINAYHQPGVEAGKKAAGSVIAFNLKLIEALKASPEDSFTAEALAEHVGAADKAELAFKILERLAANKYSGIKKRAKKPVFESTYRFAG